MATENTQVSRQELEVIRSNVVGAPNAILTIRFTEDGFIGQNLTNALISGNSNVSKPGVFVGNTNYVGIGTSSPNDKLAVSGRQFIGTYVASDNATIDWNSENIQSTDANAGTITFVEGAM